MSAEEFSKVWENRIHADFIIAHRYGRISPLSRKIISWISRLIVGVFYGDRIYDVNAPYRLMRCSVFKDFWEMIPDDTFAPNIVISGIATYLNFKVIEIPITHYNRATGKVSIQKFKLLKMAVKSLIQTIKCRFLI